jgi:hypothetical protein
LVAVLGQFYDRGTGLVIGAEILRLKVAAHCLAKGSAGLFRKDLAGKEYQIAPPVTGKDSLQLGKPSQKLLGYPFQLRSALHMKDKALCRLL